MMICKSPLDVFRSQLDVFMDIYNSGITGPLFDYIDNRLNQKIYEARNIHGDRDDDNKNRYILYVFKYVYYILSCLCCLY